VFYVANTESRLHAVDLPDEKGILPDYYITQNIDEYLNNVDTLKEFTVDLINSNQ
jgi:hypothetical protein